MLGRRKADHLILQYNSTQGRWMTPDPAGMAAADPANPQSWNRYAYVMNNPLNATDPLGLCYFGDGATIGVSGPRNPGLECGTGALDSSKPSAPQCSNDPGSNLPPCFTIEIDTHGNISPVQLLKYDYALGLQLENGTWRPTTTDPRMTISAYHPPVSTCLWQATVAGTEDVLGISVIPGTDQDNWDWSWAKLGFVYTGAAESETIFSPSTGVDAVAKTADFVKGSSWAQAEIRQFARSQGAKISMKAVSKDAATIGKGFSLFGKALAAYSAYQRYQKCRGN